MALKGIMKSLLEWVIIIAVAFVLSIFIRNYLVDTRIVPTGSMLPTIQLQDRLIVDRFFYKHDTLKRGDIIVFSAPESAQEDKDLVKRVIGLPGEKVQVKNGKVFINEKALNEPYIAATPDYEYGPVTVPQDAYFMLGDNRRASKDSHVWGFLPADKILGRVWIRYWPLDKFGPLGKVPEHYFAEEGENEICQLDHGLGESFLEILKTARYKDTISFAGGLPAQELFPNEDLKACFIRVFEEDGPVALQYAEALGYSPLRQWISTQFPNGCMQRDMDEIIITTGSQQGLSLVARP